MRRKLLGGLVALALAATASACGGSGDGSSGGPVTLSLGIWDKNQKPMMDKLVADFTKQHAGIQVKVQITPWEQYWTKLQSAASGGSAPDVFWMNGPNFQLYASNGVLAPVSDRIAKDGVDMSVFPKALVDLYTYQGKVYGMPKDFDTIGLWYNKSLFDKAGVKYPDASWTWDDLRAAAKKLTDKSTGVYGIAAPATAQQNYYNTIFQAGGSVISADGTKSGYTDPATVSGLKFWTDLIADGSSPTYQQMVDTAPVDMFQSGKVAMHYEGSWFSGTFYKNAELRGKIDVAPLPQGPNGRATVIHGLSYVTSAKSKHPNEAWQLVKYLGSKQAADIAAGGTAIPAYQGTQDAWVKSMPEFDVQAFIDELQYSVPFPVSKNTAAWNADQDEILTKVWTGKLSVAAGASQLATKMQADLDKEQKD